MEVEVMGRGGRKVEGEGEGGKGKTTKLRNGMMFSGQARKSGRRKISCVTVAEKPAHCTGTRQTESQTRRSY